MQVCLMIGDYVVLFCNFWIVSTTYIMKWKPNLKDRISWDLFYSEKLHSFIIVGGGFLSLYYGICDEYSRIPWISELLHF